MSAEENRHCSWAPKWLSLGFPALWDFGRSEFSGLFEKAERPWDILKLLDMYLSSRLEAVSGPKIRSFVPAGVHIEGDVFIDEACTVEDGAYVRGPAWIGRGCEIRSGCYIRGGVLVGEGAVLGHSSEFKHCIVLDHAQAPHFNYVGDSIMGHRAHIGAGVILSNFRLDGKNVPVRALGSKHNIDSGLSKFGALIGDGCEVGCNTVLNPGTILGEKSVVMPLSSVAGTWPHESRIDNQVMMRPS